MNKKHHKPDQKRNEYSRKKPQGRNTAFRSHKSVRWYSSDKTKAAIAIYANIALENVWRKAEVGDDSENTIRSMISENPEKLRRLAHFIWTFRDETPQKNYSDEELGEFVGLFVEKLKEIRNVFSHYSTDKGIDEVLNFGDKDSKFYQLYVLLQGVLYESAVFGKFHDAKGRIWEEKLFSYSKGNRVIKKDGVIFLICCALFKDEAEEFIKRLPDRNFNLKYNEELRFENADARKACLSYYSLKRSFADRLQINTDEKAYHRQLNFAEIIGYLNKVPTECLQNLPLAEDRQLLEKEKNTALANGAQDAETRFVQVERKREKFISFALRGIEDFNLIPELRFKRRDFSPGRRTEFSYGVSLGEYSREVKYAVNPDKVDFEFLPENHHENTAIKIKSLHASMPPKEFERMFWFLLTQDEKKSGILRSEIRSYLSAYHRLYERILSLDDEALKCGLLPEDYQEELESICGESVEKLFAGSPEPHAGSFIRKTKSILPKTIAGLFETELPPESDKKLLLRKNIEKAIRQAEALKNRIEKDEATDSEKVRSVFLYFNYLLDDDEKFRQLPRGEQHRGPEDYEYQYVQKLVALYKLQKDKKTKRTYSNLWDYFEENRPEFGAKLKSLRFANNLRNLALQALREYTSRCSLLLTQIDSMSPPKIDCHCRKFKVRRAVYPCTHAVLMNAILGIREGKNLWPGFQTRQELGYTPSSREFNGFAASQIPLPNGIVERAFKQAFPKGDMQLATHMKFDLEKNRLALRNFYDCSNLKAWLEKKEKRSSFQAVNGKTISYSEADNLLHKIKGIFARDSLLLHLLKKYLENGFLNTKNKNTKIASIWNFFQEEIQISVKAKGIRNAKIKTPFRNLARADFSSVASSLGGLFSLGIVKPILGTNNVFSFDAIYNSVLEQKPKNILLQRAAYPILIRLDEEFPGKIDDLIYPVHCKLTNTSFTHDQMKNGIKEFRNAIFHNHIDAYRNYEKIPKEIQKLIEEEKQKNLQESLERKRGKTHFPITCSRRT